MKKMWRFSQGINVCACMCISFTKNKAKDESWTVRKKN